MKTYKIDTTQYTEEQITLLATFYGYQPQEGDTLESKMDFIESEFKKMADSWFAQPLINEVNRALEVERQAQTEAIKTMISTSTVVTDEI
jgi:hypothetical protein